MSKEEKQIKEIIDNDLDTGRDLVTENYQLEILTLKDKVDLRRFSRAFLKVDKLLKNIFSNKLDKGEYRGNAQDLKNEIDTKLPVNEAYKNYVKAERIGDTDIPVDSTIVPGKYQCGASGGKYHLSYLDIIDLFPSHKRQIHHKFGSGIQWRDIYNSDFSNVSWNTFWDSVNSPKSHEVENRGDKIFTPLGALNLKNWLVENYTTLMNNIRDNLTNVVNTKTPHGGYSQTTQQLKNEVDTKVGIGTVVNQTEQQIKNLPTGIYQCSQCVIGKYNGEDIYPFGTMQVYKQGGQSIQVYTTFYSQVPKSIYGTFMRRTDDSGTFREFYKVYDSVQKPTPREIGAFRLEGVLNNIPKTYSGATQVQAGSPDYADVGGGSQHFLIQMSTEHEDESNAYVGQIAFGYSPDNPKIAIRCKNPSKNGAFVELLTKNSIDWLYCPYRVGDIISSTNQANPAATWLGTTWEKLENCFLYGHNTVGARGGSSQINLTVAQLPPHNMGSNYLRRVGGDGTWDYRPSQSIHPDDAAYFNSDTIGSGHAIGIMPPYYTVFMWRRTS